MSHSTSREQVARDALAAAITPVAQDARIGVGHYLVLAAALLGWMFDGLEMGLFPLVARPALIDLLGAVDDGVIARWNSAISAGFLVGAATGGVLFGWLGDRLGRVRAMMLSVFTYAIFTGICGIAGSAEQIAAFRFISALGMGGEWSLGVALVMEVWPNRSRSFLAGLIGAASNVGFLLIATVGLGLTAVLGMLSDLLGAMFSAETVDWLVRNSGWRIMLMMGAVPALLTLFIRIFVPESERWQQEHERGSTSHWAAADLVAVLIGAIGPCAMIYVWTVDETSLFGGTLAHSLALRAAVSLVGLVIAIVGYAYPVTRYLQRAGSAAGSSAASEVRGTITHMFMGAGVGGIALVGTWGATQWITLWADQLTGGTNPTAKAYSGIASASGAIIGTMLAAWLGDKLGRRVSYSLLCLASLGSAMLLFLGEHEYGPTFLALVFLVGLCTASFYGWLPFYLPELFRTAVRATGQGFSFNFGRILAAAGVLAMGQLVQWFDEDYARAGATISLIYLVGLVLIWFCPETKGKPLPE
ncbi:MAG: MFS transporter [Pirellulales bacterium]|nr:MFS transporter [Pirellulales bacterium]